MGTSVGVSAQKVVDKLDEIKVELSEMCDGCEALPKNCSLLGTAYFGEDSHRIERMTWHSPLPRQGPGLFLNVGYAF